MYYIGCWCKGICISKKLTLFSYMLFDLHASTRSEIIYNRLYVTIIHAKNKQKCCP